MWFIMSLSNYKTITQLEDNDDDLTRKLTIRSDVCVCVSMCDADMHFQSSSCNYHHSSDHHNRAIWQQTLQIVLTNNSFS